MAPHIILGVIGALVGLVLFVVGVGLLIGGGLIAFEAHSCVQEYETILGQFGRTLSTAAQQEYEQCQMYRIGGAVAAVFGLGLIGSIGNS